MKKIYFGISNQKDKFFFNFFKEILSVLLLGSATANSTNKSLVKIVVGQTVFHRVSHKLFHELCFEAYQS